MAATQQESSGGSNLPGPSSALCCIAMTSLPDRSAGQSRPSDVVAIGSCVPLGDRDQTRNVRLFATNVALMYLGSPLFYVGITLPVLCKRLAASDTVSNLPSTAYFLGAFAPVLVAWLFPFARLLKPVLAVTYGILGLAGAVLATALAMYRLGASSTLMIALVVTYSAIAGACVQVIATFQWEAIGRGISESRRGRALGLAFGIGPVFAVVGALAQQLLLQGHLQLPVFLAAELGRTQIAVARLAFPWNFALLFAATIPLMALAAVLSMRFVVPLPTAESVRQPFVAGVFGGIRQLLSHQVTRMAVIVNILIFAGAMIVGNVALYAEKVLGKPVDCFAGYQNALRFGFKVVIGLALGWLLARTNPRLGMICTGLLCLLGVLWAATAEGTWYLLSFGLLGAGELYGVYFPNYILSCSAPSTMRTNMAIASMLPMIAAPAAVLFGAISDKVGFHTSFMGAAGIIVTTLLLVLLGLPRRPMPQD